VLKSELGAYRQLLECIQENGERNGNFLEIRGCLLTINYNKENWQKFVIYRKSYLKLGKGIIRRGWDRGYSCIY